MNYLDRRNAGDRFKQYENNWHSLDYIVEKFDSFGLI